jgi:signal transduction histidine kinase
VAMNALEAMKDGGTLTISVSQEASKIRVDFADDGHGIREDDLPKIFTPFFTTHEMGTGLGLSVVHNIIIAHGGDVSVRSREGGGAEFTISLPAEDQPDGGVRR